MCKQWISFPLHCYFLTSSTNLGLQLHLPQFVLASLHTALGTTAVSELKSRLDLSCLHTIVTGGEACVVELCIALTQQLQKYGAPGNVLTPAFGLTETCGGVTYSKDFPRRDIECNNEFATNGVCIPGSEMRITDENGTDIGQNVTGNLEFRGFVVFNKYYNNTEATTKSFNQNWFVTGDLGSIDSLGQLNLTQVTLGELFFPLFGCFESLPNVSAVLRHLDTPLYSKFVLN